MHYPGAAVINAIFAMPHQCSKLAPHPRTPPLPPHTQTNTHHHQPHPSGMQDQVHHLTVLGINAACVGGSMDWQQQAQVYSSLHEADGCKASKRWQAQEDVAAGPHFELPLLSPLPPCPYLAPAPTTPPSLQVLFITPEKLSASGKLQSTLDSLHRRGLLARVVVDEAHW